jgi:peptidoglycan/xylan/chitin deacetylase (PgdA/CDA1 family)
MMRREITIVLYHHISEDMHPLTKHLGVTTGPDLFAKHVRYFKQNFDFVSGSELITGVLPRKPILVTFDDAYRSVLDVAGPILKAASAPSVFFVNPATVIDSFLPIDNILSIAIEELGWERVISVLQLDNTGVTSATQSLTELFAKLTPIKIRTVKDQLCSAMGANETEIRRATNLFLGPADIKALSSFPMEIGNHSMSHTFFRSLSPDELRTEVVESRTLLQSLSGQSVLYLSIPYGNRLDATENALEIARESGHKAIFLVHAKSNRFPPELDVFYRISPGNASTQALPFKLRVMPLLRSIRDIFGEVTNG